MFEVDEDLLEQLLIRIGKSKKCADEDVLTLEKWIKERPHFSKPLDKRSILNFLILNKFSIEKSKQKIDSYYTTGMNLSDIFQECKPHLPHMKEIREIIYYVGHPQLLDNHMVVFFKIRRKDLIEKCTPYNVIRYTVGLGEMRLRNDFMYGDVGVFDCADLTVSFFFKMTPSLFYKFMIAIYQNILSYPLKGLYFINFPSYGSKLITIFKQIMKPKLFERLHFIEDNNILKEIFPDDFLPEDFGGKGPSLSNLQEMLEEEFQKNAELFNQLEDFYVKENLRPASLENDEMLGFHGNFKQLNVD